MTTNFSFAALLACSLSLCSAELHAAPATPAPAVLTPAAAGIPLTKEEVATMRSCEVTEITRNQEAFIGKIVKIKFGYRNSTFDKTADGSFSGLVGNSYKEYKSYSGLSLNIKVGQEGADWFSKVSTDYSNRKTYVAFARINKGPTNGVIAELIGREIRTDMKGSKIIW